MNRRDKFQYKTRNSNNAGKMRSIFTVHRRLILELRVAQASPAYTWVHCGDSPCASPHGKNSKENICLQTVGQMTSSEVPRRRWLCQHPCRLLKPHKRHQKSSTTTPGRANRSCCWSYRPSRGPNRCGSSPNAGWTRVPGNWRCTGG